MDRYWFSSNTFYGNRVPGDARGFVGRVWEHRPLEPEDERRVTHNGPGTPCDAGMGVSRPRPANGCAVRSSV